MMSGNWELAVWHWQINWSLARRKPPQKSLKNSLWDCLFRPIQQHQNWLFAGKGNGGKWIDANRQKIHSGEAIYVHACILYIICMGKGLVIEGGG
jgi:hypothetical protein